MLRTKINVNLGVSRDCKDYDIEMQKVMSAVNLGAEAIMDLSSHGNTQPFRQKLTHECPAMIGTVPDQGRYVFYLHRWQLFLLRQAASVFQPAYVLFSCTLSVFC